MISRMKHGSSRVLECKRSVFAKNKLDNLQITYTLGRDYDRELDNRRQFMEEVLLELENTATTTNASEKRNNDEILQCLALYFSYFYDIQRVIFVRSSTPSFGVDLSVSERELRIACDEIALTSAFFASEAIRDDRVTVNDISMTVENSYSSRRDMRIHTLLAFFANVEATVIEKLSELSTELTLVEMLFATEEDIRGRCDDVRIIRRPTTSPSSSSCVKRSVKKVVIDEESFLP